MESQKTIYFIFFLLNVAHAAQIDRVRAVDLQPPMRLVCPGGLAARSGHAP
jgi:hypothetical protein